MQLPRLAFVRLATVLVSLGGGCVKEGGADVPDASGGGGSRGGNPVSTGGNGGILAGAGGEGGAGAGDVLGAGGEGQIPALPPKAFIFVRQAAPASYHLYAYDLERKSQTLISRLDDTTHSFGGGAVSNDRRWVAFGAHGFRANPSELLKKAGALWAVSADGKQFKRLSPELKIVDGTEACAKQSDCPLGQTCSGTCKWANLSSGFGYPIWTADDKTVYFQFALAFSCVGLPVSSCLGASVTAVRDGAFLPTPDSPCRFAGTPNLHLPTGKLVVYQTGCGGPSTGFYEWTLDPLASKQMLLGVATGMDVVTNPVWLSDGSGILFSFTNSSEGYEGIARWNASTGERQVIYRTPDANTAIGTIASGPGGTVVFDLSTKVGMDVKTDLQLLDLQASKTTPLTTTGDSSSPGW
jgi:hypothetical protein